ncbi:glycoside hydrolase 5 family protein [Jiangella anatolica]|uniref:glycoside hydrolase 5 family protein n=1 Tax=Jiangella anatolica TaxID=2670374 RepID=UPI001313F840|nr:glycosyl hydrolase [Jiangella anatolica]
MTDTSASADTGPAPARDVRFGVNYVPSGQWWYAWVDWEPAAIAADLAAIAGLGFDHVRVHCLWPLFQLDPGRPSAAMLGRLSELVALAGDAGLDVCVTVLDGWLSGTDFRPHWLPARANVFTDPLAIAAQRQLLAAVLDAVGGHPRFLGADIANEPNVLVDVAGNAGTTTAQGDAWVTQLLALCEERAPGKLHVAGFDHQPWLADSPFSREVLATTGAATAIHAWTYFTGALERYGAAGTGTTHLAEYMIELAKAYHADPRRPVWLQEYGASADWLPEPALPAHAAAFTEAALSCANLWGVTWWASHDIDRRFRGFAELEYGLGLLTTANSVKPAGARLRELIADHRAAPVAAPARPVALVLGRGRRPGLDFADRFFQLVDDGVRPAIVRAERRHDEGYLAERGITQLVEEAPARPVHPAP